MPPLKEHLEISRERTGKEFAEVHEWLDGDEERKADRHDAAKIHEYGAMLGENHGEEALVEYIQHIYDDIRVPPGDGSDDTKSYWRQEADIQILKTAGVPIADIGHCVKVAEKAVEIAGRTGADVDMELVVRGALFHDLGKAETHEIEHGRIGAELGEALGLPPEIRDVMEKHIRGGLSREEAMELGLPVKDYTLARLEERIIIYADRLVDIITDGVVPISSELEAEVRFEEILKNYPQYGKNEPTLERYLGYHKEIQGLIAEFADAGGR